MMKINNGMLTERWKPMSKTEKKIFDEIINKRQMKTKGKFFWKQTWYSICSIHGTEHSNTCHMCDVGSWHYNWLTVITNFFHKNWYGLWYRCVNRTWNIDSIKNDYFKD